MNRKKYYSLDLFAGAGGLTLGLENAGFETVAAIESDRFAVDTFKYNFPNVEAYLEDIRSFSNQLIKKRFGGIDLLVGGPPCQGFSVAGPYKFGIIDDRNNMVQEYLRFVYALKPKVCIIENVRNITQGKLPSQDRKVVDYIQDSFKRLGYKVKVDVLFAPHYGIPQSRTRVFIYAVQNDIDLQFPMVNKTHGTGQRSFITVEEAIYDLPFIDSGEGFDNEPYQLKYNCAPKSNYQKRMRKGSSGIYNHVAMKHSPRLIERFKYIPQGGSLVDVPPEHGQRQRNGHSLDARPRFKMNNTRLDPKDYSKCVTASFQSTFVHPILNRNLTAREGARLQSFPDSFIFKGPRTLMSKTLLERENRLDEIGLSQYNQIGNAVPPLLAEKIGKAILKTLN